MVIIAIVWLWKSIKEMNSLMPDIEFVNDEIISGSVSSELEQLV